MVFEKELNYTYCKSVTLVPGLNGTVRYNCTERQFKYVSPICRESMNS
jgi:hypothetical protein